MTTRLGLKLRDSCYHIAKTTYSFGKGLLNNATRLCWIPPIILSQSYTSTPLAPMDFSTLEQMAKERVDKEYLPGISIAAIEGDKTHFFSYGTRIAGERAPLISQTRFRIASITKLFTATLTLLLAQNKTLDLDRSVSSYLPMLPYPYLQLMRVEHLLNHTAGFTEDMIDNFVAKGGTYLYESDAPQFYEILKNSVPSRKPGESYEYSNIGYALLGHLIEKATNQTLDGLFDEHIFKPLNMDHTRFPHPLEDTKDLAEGYVNGKVVESKDPKYLHGYAGLTSTAADLIKVVRASLFIDQAPPKLKGAFKAMQEALLKTAPSTESSIGWSLDRSFRTELYYVIGIWKGYYAFLGFDKTSKRGIVILSNSQFYDDLGKKWLDNRFQVPSLPDEIELDNQALSSFTGTFYEVDDPSSRITITLDESQNKLYFSINEYCVPLYAKEEKTFILKNFPPAKEVKFCANTEGNALELHLTLREDSNRIIFKRQ